MTVIGDDAAPRAERTVVLWNPPLLDEELGLRGSPLAEAAKLQAAFVERGLRTLTFAKSRKAAELIHRFTAERLGDDSRLSPYRAGYTPQQRREIERRLGEGDLLGVSATNALELGIDVGLLDAVISVGFPGTVASLRQQWGRAGRRGHGLAVLVAGEDGLDQYFMREPDKLLGRRVEAALLDHASPRVLAGHVRAAAFEAPIDEARRRDPRPGGARRPRRPTRSCARRRAGFVWAGKDYPRGARRPALGRARRVLGRRRVDRRGARRSSSARAPTRRCTRARSTSTSASRTSCTSSTTTAMRAVVEPFRGDWYTQAEVRDADRDRAAAARGAAAAGSPLVFGEIEVTEQVVGYERKTIRSQERIELVPLDAAAVELRDRGDLVRARAAAARGARRDAEAARDAARGRARADRDAAALGDVRPLGHRRPLDEPPPPDRPADGLRLRRPRRRRSGSPSAASSSSRAGSPTRRGWSPAARARTAARRACRARSAATSNDMLDKAGARTFLERLVSAAPPHTQPEIGSTARSKLAPAPWSGGDPLPSAVDAHRLAADRFDSGHALRRPPSPSLRSPHELGRVR